MRPVFQIIPIGLWNTISMSHLLKLGSWYPYMGAEEEERNHFIHWCSYMSLNREDKAIAIQVHSVFHPTRILEEYNDLMDHGFWFLLELGCNSILKMIKNSN